MIAKKFTALFLLAAMLIGFCSCMKKENVGGVKIMLNDKPIGYFSESELRIDNRGYDFMSESFGVTDGYYSRLYDYATTAAEKINYETEAENGEVIKLYFDKNPKHVGEFLYNECPTIREIRYNEKENCYEMEPLESRGETQINIVVSTGFRYSAYSFGLNVSKKNDF